MRTTLAICFILWLTACAGGHAANELERNRDLWQQEGPAQYSYVVTFDCFCPEESRGQFAVSVGVDGTSLRRLDSADPSTPPTDPSIDGLFEYIESHLDSDWLEVQYSDATGHPISISVDPTRDVFDDELAVRVSDFVSVDLP